jgi:hypothetical protein
MADIDIRRALFQPETAHARYNLEGVLHDLERFHDLGIPPDKVIMDTVRRVIKQLVTVENLLNGDH